MRPSHLVLSVLIASLVGSPGCGERTNTVWVTGKLLKGGVKYVPPEGQLVSVTLVGIEIQDNSGKAVQSSEPFWAEIDPTSGTFVVPGNEGRGIPLGKYRVAVTQKMSREAYDAKPHPRPTNSITRVDRETDMLKGRFGMAHSPIIREIKTSCELVIDLDRPEGEPGK
jgi:hypothetical protein